MLIEFNSMESAIGLGFKNIPGGTRRPSFFEQLVIANNNDPSAAPEISFFFGRDSTPGQRSTQSMSEMSIGIPDIRPLESVDIAE